MRYNALTASICAATALSCAFAFAPIASASQEAASSQESAVTQEDGSAASDDADVEPAPTPEPTPAPTPSYKLKIKKGYTFTAGKATYKVIAAPKKKTQVKKGATAQQTTYKLTGKVVLVSYKGGKKANIPAQVKASVKKTADAQGNTFAEQGVFSVEQVGKGAFDNAKGHKVTSVTIGKNVVSIGDKAFCNCKKLTKIVLKGDAIRTIGVNSDAKLNRKSKSYVKNLYKLRTKKWKTCKVFYGVPRTCAIVLPNINASKGLKYNIEYANAIRLLTGNASYVGVVK